MLRNYGSLLLYFVFWYVVLTVARIVFIVLNWHLASEVSILDLFSAHFHGLRLDISIICYICVIPLILWFSSYFVSNKTILNRVLKIYTVIILALVILITTADAELYRYWEQKLNSYASSFAKFPKDMLAFSSGVSYLKLAIVIALQIVCAYLFSYTSLNGLDKIKHSVNKVVVSFVFLIMLGLLFIGIRGGIGKSTINQSFAYYSPNPFLNHVAVNASWNFVASVVEPLQTVGNPYTFIDEKEAEKTVKQLFENRKDKAPVLINQSKPNIVLVILEGWTADVIEPLGGDKDVTPEFNELCKEGYLFTNFYANGNRTDKGLAAIISGQPALATHSIINQIEKFTSLPSLSGELKKHGYHTSFFYGGQSEFANMKAYWLSAGYDQIKDLYAFPTEERNAEWGVHDDVLWKKVLNDLDEESSPFMASVLTVSSHEPFHVPVQSRFKGNDDPNMYRNAVHFADHALGEFFHEAEKKPWFKHTLFIVVADHGHRWPRNRKAFEPDMYRIPFLLYGGALNKEYIGKTNPVIANQVDIPVLVLEQLSLPYQSFNWSKNVLNHVHPFATYVFNDGIGIVTPQGRLVFDQESKLVIHTDGNMNDSLKVQLTKDARCYEQVYYDEYLKR